MRVAVHRSVAPVFPPERLAAALEGRGLGADVTDDPAGAGFDCVVAFEHDDAFFECPWVHAITAGYNDYPVDRYRKRGVTFTNSTGIHGATVGETVAGACLSFARRLHRYRDRQRERRWDREPYDAAFTVAGERACVVGLGSIGRGAATRLDALGADVVGVRRTPASAPGVREVYTPDALRDAIRDARFVALAVPLTDDTRGLIGEDELAAMRADAYLINVARGAVVDQDALIDALEDGEIAGAALDVFEAEPLPEDSRLWDREDVILTPHVSGLSNRYHAGVADLVATSADRIERGETPVNEVV